MEINGGPEDTAELDGYVSRARVADGDATDGVGRQCGYSLCATLWPSDLIRYTGKGRKGGRPAEYHTDERWAPEKVTCRDLGIAEQRDNRVREAMGRRPDLAGRVGPAVHRPDLDNLRDLLARMETLVAPAVTVLTEARTHLGAVATTLEQDTQAALRRAETARTAERDERARRRRAENTAEAAQATAVEATRRATAAETARDTALKQAGQAVDERQTAQDLAATLAEQLDTANTNQRLATAELATRTAERDAATARITALDTALRDQAARHTSDLDAARHRYDTALAQLRTEDRAARDQLHNDLKTGYDQQLHELTERHDRALTELREQLRAAHATAAHAEAAATEARATADRATHAATTHAAHRATLREGILTALATLVATDPDEDAGQEVVQLVNTLRRTLTTALDNTTIAP